MWLSYVATLIAGAVFVYAPGYLLLRAARFGRSAAFCCAPLISLAVYPILGVAYAVLHIFASWATMFVPVLAVSVAAYAIARFVRPQARVELGIEEPLFHIGRARRSGDAVVLVGYIAIGLAVGWALFASQLQSPDAIYQWVDSVHHLSQVRNYLDSGIWSTFDVRMYRAPGEEAFDPYAGGAFYPSTWHVATALAASFTGATVPVATNAMVLVFSSIVFPAGMFFLLRVSATCCRRCAGCLLHGGALDVSLGVRLRGTAVPQFGRHGHDPACRCAVRERVSTRGGRA